MIRFRLLLPLFAFALSGCSAPDSPRLTSPPAPSLDAGGVDRAVVLVNPKVKGNGTAATIQQGIDMVAPGGRVMILPGTYAESLVVDRAVTLEGIGGESGDVLIAVPGKPLGAVLVTTTDPVIIRNVHVQYSGNYGLGGYGAVQITLDHVIASAVNALAGSVAAVINNSLSGQARLAITGSTLDGGVTNRPPPYPLIYGVRVSGGVDATIAGNVVRRAGAACIWVQPRSDLAGATNADIVDNDVDECYPAGRSGAIVIGPSTPLPPIPPSPATGVVNVVGNSIHNSQGSCMTSTGISYEYFGGAIEHNVVEGVVQPCATPTARNMPAGIWVGSRLGLPAATRVVRFNDLTGNAAAGLRLGLQHGVIDATCNWWGAASGPSGLGPGLGDALLIEAGATTPSFAPFATEPIARTSRTTC